MLRRLLIGILLFLVIGTLILPQLAACSHFLLSLETDKISLYPADGWSALIHLEKARQFYWIFLALTALLLGWVLVAGNYLAYRSKMQKITPDIRTPSPAGQGQFGTARWLNPKHIGRFFSIWKPARHAKWFKQLIAAGKKSHKEVKNAHVRID